MESGSATNTDGPPGTVIHLSLGTVVHRSIVIGARSRAPAECRAPAREFFRRRNRSDFHWSRLV